MVSRWAIVVLAAMLGCAAAARGQDLPSLATPPGISSPTQASDESAEEYLTDHKLWEVLGARLRRQLREGTPEDQVRAINLLGSLYVRMLTDATTPEQRQAVEAAARELLKDPRAETEAPELRLNLAKASYLKVEDIVERNRLKLASSEERAEAERVLRTTMPVFEEIGRRVEAKVKGLEAKEKSANAPDMDALRLELAEQRRIRSLAWYYAGWSRYYSALLTNTPSQALEAMRRFGGLLNAVSPERPPTIDRVPKNLLRYEHVARAAMGCALCASLQGNHTEAARWLDLVQEADEVAPIVLDQLFSRRVIVHAAASQWADIDLAVRRRRRPDPELPPQPLSVADARLLAVTALETAKATQSDMIRAEAEKQAQLAFADLIQRGEAGHVLDLVSLYGTSPIGQEGFIVAYVRSLQAYERARTAHKAAGNDDEPAADDGVVNLYREAAGLLKAAGDSGDAAQFPKEREKAVIREGLALFYAGDLEAAARRFQQAADISVSPPQKRDAMWYSIVALDRAVEKGNRGLTGERDRVATLFLEQFPSSENAAKLLLRQTRADRLTDAQALDILMKVGRDSPIYEASRKQAARLLFQAYRKAPPGEKDFAAVRFSDIAEGVLKLEQARAMAGTDDVAREAANDLVIRVRQIADALLSMSAPDIARVEAAFAVLESVAAYQAMDLTQLDGELTFRRVQMAVSRNDEPTIVKLVDSLRNLGGPFSSAADRLLYRRAVRTFAAKTPANEIAASKQVVQFGLHVLESPDADKDPATPGIRESVAEAAALLWRQDSDASMRDLAIRIDTAQIASGNRTASSLRRLGVLYEAAGNDAKALDAWRDLLNGLAVGTNDWYEARYESLRLLLDVAPAEAEAAMKQHKVLHPGLGPQPWGDKLAQLEARMSVPTPAPSGNSSPPAASTGGGK